MRKLAQLWRAIEDTPSLTAVHAAWAAKCGSDFPFVERFLSPTGDFATKYPCPRPTGYHCPRLVIGGDGGPFEALCQDPHKVCSDLSLTAKDVVLHTLDLDGFMKPILKVAGIRNPQMEPHAPGVRNVGLAARGDLSLQPAYLLIFVGTQEFGHAAQFLAFETEGAFTIIAPTERHWTGTLQERMRLSRIAFMALNERVFLDDSERFVAVRPLPCADGLRPTPPERRTALLEQFRQNNGNCGIKQICYWAKVSREDLNKWKNGRPAVPDTSVKAIRIEQLLQLGIRSRE